MTEDAGNSESFTRKHVSASLQFRNNQIGLFFSVNLKCKVETTFCKKKKKKILAVRSFSHGTTDLCGKVYPGYSTPCKPFFQ